LSAVIFPHSFLTFVIVVTFWVGYSSATIARFSALLLSFADCSRQRGEDCLVAMVMFSEMQVWSQGATYSFLALQAVCILSAWIIASRDREERMEAAATAH
jgi:hypothetical protein